MLLLHPLVTVTSSIRFCHEGTLTARCPDNINREDKGDKGGGGGGERGAMARPLTMSWKSLFAALEDQDSYLLGMLTSVKLRRLVQ